LTYFPWPLTQKWLRSVCLLFVQVAYWVMLMSSIFRSCIFTSFVLRSPCPFTRRAYFVTSRICNIQNALTDKRVESSSVNISADTLGCIDLVKCCVFWFLFFVIFCSNCVIHDWFIVPIWMWLCELIVSKVKFMLFSLGPPTVRFSLSLMHVSIYVFVFFKTPQCKLTTTDCVDKRCCCRCGCHSNHALS